MKSFKLVSDQSKFSQIELLLNYANRFYDRQFITRKVVNNDVLNRLEVLLENYFNEEKSLTNGLPSVDFVASELSLTPRYLSDMLRNLIGLNTQQFIHEKLIDWLMCMKETGKHVNRRHEDGNEQNIRDTCK